MTILQDIIISDSPYHLYDEIIERMKREANSIMAEEREVMIGILKANPTFNRVDWLDNLIKSQVETQFSTSALQIAEKLFIAEKFLRGTSDLDSYLKERGLIIPEIVNFTESKIKHISKPLDIDTSRIENEKFWLYNLHNIRDKIPPGKRMLYVANNNQSGDPLFGGCHWQITILEGEMKNLSNSKLKDQILSWALEDMRYYFDAQGKKPENIDLRKIFSKDYISLFKTLKLNMVDEYIHWYNDDILTSDNYMWNVSFEARVTVDFEDFDKNRENTDHPAYHTLDYAEMDDDGVITYSGDFEFDADEIDPLSFDAEVIQEAVEKKFLDEMSYFAEDSWGFVEVFVVDNDMTIEVLSAEFDGMEKLIIR